MFIQGQHRNGSSKEEPFRTIGPDDIDPTDPMTEIDRPEGTVRAAMTPIELILARQVASYLALPILVTDARGNTFFYNEPAERLFGLPFDEVGPQTLRERIGALELREDSGEPVPFDDVPLVSALRQRHPSNRRLTMRGFDGVDRPVEVTAFPLTRADGTLVGGLSIIWEHPGPTP